MTSETDTATIRHGQHASDCATHRGDERCDCPISVLTALVDGDRDGFTVETSPGWCRIKVKTAEDGEAIERGDWFDESQWYVYESEGPLAYPDAFWQACTDWLPGKFPRDPLRLALVLHDAREELRLTRKRVQKALYSSTE